jgi:predicted lipoprotein with Yx(FWY)xxD motif
MFRSTRIGFLTAAAAALLAASIVTACGSSSNNNTTTSPAARTSASGQPAAVGVANNSNLGKILVDSQGRTLYLFQRDMGKTSACTGACAAAWPPVRAAGTPVVGTGLSASKVGTTARTDGKPQVTYNGHPLYLYSADMKAGDTNGQGVTAFGGGWFALSPAGNMVSGTGSTSGGANGY